MRKFLDWFNKPAAMDPVLKAAQAHLWFVTIHPFDDGNGRLARAIADMSLARSEDSPQRFYSKSAQIRLERAAYYDVLERTQKGTLDITPWMEWFLLCLGRAIDGAQTMLAAVLAKARYWEFIAGFSINERQRRVLNRLLDGFEGKLTTSKYAKLAKCSQDTALRDILALVEHGARKAGGAPAMRWRLLQNLQLLSHPREHLQSPVQFAARMRCAHDSAHPRLAFRHGRKPDAGRQHAFLKQRRRQRMRCARLPHNHRRNRRFTDARVEPGCAQPLLEVSRIVPQRLD
jgi:hypothetical protein